MPTQDKYANWQNLIAQNRLEKVLAELREVFAQSEHLMNIIQQQGRHASLVEEIMDGTISQEDKTLTEDRIRKSILLLLQDMKNLEETDEAVAREIAEVRIGGDTIASIINSRVEAGRDVNITYQKVYNYPDGPIEHFLTKMPQNPPVFEGRAEELKDLHRRLFSGEGDHVILLVNGQGGVGKSSMANRYFFDYHHEYHHAGWVLKDGSIRDALLTLEQGLGLKFTTETTEQRLATILRKVANLKAPCLLIIDNANERDDLVRHIKELRQCANFHVLLTSRLNSFDGAATYKVGALPEPVAKKIFEGYYRKFDAEEVDLFPAVYAAVDGNTLVLQLLAKNLKKNRRKYTLPQLLTDLQERGVLDLSRSKKVVTDYQDFDEDQIEHIVAAMFDLGDLTEPQLQLLSVFAALPPEKIPYEHLEVLVTFLDDLDETLDELQQLGWVEEKVEKTEADDVDVVSYRCSPVVQAVVRANNVDWREVLPSLRSKINAQLATDGNIIKIGIAAARPYVMYGEAIAPFLPREKANLFFYQQLAHFHNSSGDLRTNMEWVERMATLTKELLLENQDDPDLKNNLAISYSKLGETHSSLGNLNKALEYFELDIELSKELHAAFPDQVGFKNGLAISYEKLGKTHSSLGNLNKALEYFEIETILFEELHAAYPHQVGFKNGLTISYSKLGETHSALGNLNKALEYFEQYNELKKELYTAYPDQVGFKNGLAISCSKLGETHSALGNLNKALEYFEIETTLFEELHAAYPHQVGFKNGLAVSYTQLASVTNKKGQQKEYHQAAERLWAELNEQFPDYKEFERNLAWVRGQLEKL